MPKTSLHAEGTETDQMLEVASIPPSVPQEVYAMPATQAQERFWALDRLNPGNPGLNMPMMWECTGPLNLPLLNEAFTRTIERHEALRTTFAIVDGRLSQVIGLPYQISIPVTDLGHLPGAPTSAEALRLTTEHAAYRLDLEKGPLLALRLLRFSENHHMLLVTLHHIVCDGASLGVLLRDVAAYYESLVLHKRALLPELPIQFADFAIWQQEWRGTAEHQASLEYWRDTLGNQFSRINLPHDSQTQSGTAAGEVQPASSGDIETRLIPAALEARAQEFCKRKSITLNILLMSVFSALLHRITGQDDLLIATPSANRTLETEDLIGLFMNIQMMRVRLERETSFEALIGQVQEWMLGASANQQIPFEDLVHDPFFSMGETSIELPVFFLYQRSFMVNHQIGELSVVPLRSMSPGAIFEMMFAAVNRQNEGTRLQLEYNPLHFRSATIQRYLDFFLALLQSGLDDPSATVSTLSFAGSAPNLEVLSLGPQAAKPVPYESVIDAFVRHADQNPSRSAIECNGEVWSYRELGEYAARLAERLVDEGVVREARVAISLDRSPRMLGAVLAVLQAGGAFVPLDPHLPASRAAAVLADSGSILLLTDRDVADAGSAKVLRLDTFSPEKNPAHPLGSGKLPAANNRDSLALLLYSSSASGLPRGVAIEQGGLAAVVHSAGQTLGLSASDCLVAASPFDSEIAPLELLLPLTLGMRIVLPTDAQWRSRERFESLIERSRATALSATTETLHALGRSTWKPPVGFKILCDHETISPGLSEKLLDLGAELYALFGVAETSICTSITPINDGINESVNKPGAAAITGSTGDSVLYLLDAGLKPVPAGIVAELYVGGSSLARGYWNRPDVTEKSFLSNPFAPGRLFRMPNLGRWQSSPAFSLDAKVDLIERSNRQAKLEGHRVELGEIEAALLSMPDVRGAVVLRDLIPHRASSSTQIIAFVERGQNASKGVLLAEDLKVALFDVLPAYMVPKAVLAMSHFPRDKAGKLDRRTLALDPASLEIVSEVLRQEDEAEPQTSRDPIEWQLVEIWRATLGMPSISVDDSFFSLGVSSLAALRLITKMNKMYSTDLGLASLFSASTIRAIARLIREKVSPNMNSSVVPIQPHGKRPPLFILHGVGGNVVSFYGLAMHLGNDQPVYGIQAQALLAHQPALLRLEDMARYYVQEMRRVQPDGPYHLLGYSFGGTVVLEMAHQLRAAGQQVALLGMLDSKARSYTQEVRAHLKNFAANSSTGRREKRPRSEPAPLNSRDNPKSLAEKLRARSIRWTSIIATALHLKTLPSFFKDAYEINFVAALNYKPQPFDGKMTLFRASRQAIPTAPAELGWKPFFSRGVDVHMLPGDHERIFAEQNIEILASEINNCLERACGA